MIEGNEPPIRTTTSTGNAGSKRKFRLANKAVPPPRTATVRRLEQLLDAKPKKRKKLVPKRVIEPMVAPSLIVAQPPRPKDALAFRGGLASVPNFRKASMPPRKKTMVQDCDSKTSNVRSQTTDQIPRLRASDLATIQHLSSQQKRDATRLVKELQSTQDQPKKSPSLSPKIVECPLIHPTTESKSINESSTFCNIKHMEPDFQKTIPTKLDAKPDPQPREATTAHLQIGLHLGKVRKEASRSAGWKSDFQRTLMDNTTNNHDNRDILHLPPSSSKDIELATFPTVKKDIHNPPVLLQTKPSTASRTTLASQNITQTSASASTFTSSSTDCRRKATRTVNDNFVRLNLRNSAGACRGARNKKLRRKSRHHDNDYSNKNKESYASDEDMEATKFSTKSGTMREQSYVCRMTGLDPLDDYLDGVFASTIQSRKVKQNNASNQTSSTHDEAAIPLCACHQRPCKLVVVKKNTKGNKGRKFYACSMPRGEQCDHFQWAEDTIEAARQTVVDNAHHSSFIARQVAAHVDRFRNLTIPELQQEAARRRLNKHGKKSQLLLRLALWTRDEIVKAVPYPDDEKEDAEVAEIPCRPRKDAMSKEDSQESESDEEASSSSEASEEELELFHRTSQEDEESIVEELDQQKIGNDLMTHETMSSLTLLSSLTSIFGHSQFREGQEWAIERCLAGNKSLLVAPTGFGKSLCYALPAALMDGVCVVVSPLISLIQDQLRSLPPRIPAATLSGSVSASATASILDDLARKRIKILFVSPERLTSPSFRRLFFTKWNPETQQQERKFPEISLLCVDEAHCVSQWAHNFRPCFLRFKGLLRLMKPRSVLAVTATAGPRVIQDISNTLGIQSDALSQNESMGDKDNILVIDRPRENIAVSCQFVETHEERLEMLSKILKPKVSEKCSDKDKYWGVLAKGAVIIYVWRQRDTEIVTENLLSSGVKGGVVMYHGGMDASARTKAQSKFMRGKARICVATVAFGMGIDKADVEGIIHLYLSSSPEHYLQEIGRAGRDGRQAQAIALPSIDEIPIRHSLVYSNFISKSQIRALIYALKHMIVDGDANETACLHNVALPVEDLVLECDCKVETIETLLSILEQHGGDDPLFHFEGFNYDKATIALKNRTLEKLAEKEPVASCILRVATCFDPPIGKERDECGARQSLQKEASFQRHFLAYSRGSYAFSVAKCANALGPSAEPRHVFAALRRLQSSGELELALDTSSKGRVILLKISGRGLSFFKSVDFDESVEPVVDLLYTLFSSSIISGASKVLDMNYILHSVCIAGKTVQDELLQFKTEKSPSLLKFQELVHTYFGQGLSDETDPKSKRMLPETFFSVRRQELESDLFAIIRDLPILAKQSPPSVFAPVVGDSKFADYTAVTAAKFLHGLDSARAPTHAFRTHPLFGKWKQVHFQCLLEAIEKMVIPIPMT